MLWKDFLGFRVFVDGNFWEKFSMLTTKKSSGRNSIVMADSCSFSSGSCILSFRSVTPAFQSTVSLENVIK